MKRLNCRDSVGSGVWLRAESGAHVSTLLARQALSPPRACRIPTWCLTTASPIALTQASVPFAWLFV